MTEEWYEQDGNKLYRITVDDKSKTMFQAVVEEVAAYEDDGTPAEYEMVLRNVIIKWDGCSHLSFGDRDRDGYLHICDGDHWSKFLDMLKHLYELAFRYMGREPEEPIVCRCARPVAVVQSTAELTEAEAELVKQRFTASGGAGIVVSDTTHP